MAMGAVFLDGVHKTMPAMDRNADKSIRVEHRHLLWRQKRFVNLGVSRAVGGEDNAAAVG